MSAASVLGVAPAGAAADPSRVLFHLQDHRIDEASGLAVGRTSRGVLYVQNDSGDTNRFFAVDARTGATAAVVEVPGATNVDWEDIACAPDRRGRSSVWIADTGQNIRSRKVVSVYRVAEPHVTPDERGRSVRSNPPEVWRLRYPDGGSDAEALAVAPDGTGYVVTKSLAGMSRVYRVPSSSDGGRTQPMHKVGAIQFRPTGTSGGPPLIGQLAATSADISPDGRVFVVRTYTDAYLWRVRDGDVAAALTTEPTRVPLPAQPQGEGVAVDDDRLLLDSEGVGSAVYSVSVPFLAAVRADAASGAPSSSPPSSVSSASAASSPSTTSPSPAPSSAMAGSRSSTSSSGGVVAGAVVGAVVVLGAVGAVVLARRRRSARGRSSAG